MERKKKMERYTFKTDDPFVVNSFPRIAQENLDDGQIAFIITSNYTRDALIFIQESFLRSFIPNDRIFVGQQPLSSEWGVQTFHDKFRNLAIPKNRIKEASKEIEKALAFKRKVKVAVYPFGPRLRVVPETTDILGPPAPLRKPLNPLATGLPKSEKSPRRKNESEKS